MAQTLHEMSHLSSASFKSVNLCEIKPEQHEELLFGTRGLVTCTSAGTLFLNNIDHLAVTAQQSLVQFIVTCTGHITVTSSTWSVAFGLWHIN